MVGSLLRSARSSGPRCPRRRVRTGRTRHGLPGQRSADALDRLLDLTLESGRLPAEGGEKPHIQLTVDLDKLAADPGRPMPWESDPEVRAAAVTAAAQAAQQGSSGLPRFGWTG